MSWKEMSPGGKLFRISTYIAADDKTPGTHSLLIVLPSNHYELYIYIIYITLLINI
jgi:hypothetical protein